MIYVRIGVYMQKYIKKKEDTLCIAKNVVVFSDKTGYVQHVDGTRYKALLTKATLIILIHTTNPVHSKQAMAAKQ